MEALTHSRMAVEIPLYVFNEEKGSSRQSKEPIVIHFKGCTEYSSLTYRCIKIEDLRELSGCPVVLDQNIVEQLQQAI